MLPALMAISPIAHVALLHTDMYSGFKFEPSIGMKFPEIVKNNQNITHLITL